MQVLLYCSCDNPLHRVLVLHQFTHTMKVLWILSAHTSMTLLSLSSKKSVLVSRGVRDLVQDPGEFDDSGSRVDRVTRKAAAAARRVQVTVGLCGGDRARPEERH